MSGEGPEPKGPSRAWSIPSWRRIGDFIVTIAQLERSYQSLKAENDRLNDDLRNLRREVDKHSGQLDVLTHFVQAALDRQVGSIPDRPPALPKD